MTKAQTELLERVQTLAPGFYTERDGGDWYIVTPDHCERIGEDFVSRDEARQALLASPARLSRLIGTQPQAGPGALLRTFTGQRERGQRYGCDLSPSTSRTLLNACR
jgi:hypothetical protein